MLILCTLQHCLHLGVRYFSEYIVQAGLGTAPVNGGCELVHISDEFCSMIGPTGKEKRADVWIVLTSKPSAYGSCTLVIVKSLSFKYHAHNERTFLEMLLAASVRAVCSTAINTTYGLVTPPFLHVYRRATSTIGVDSTRSWAAVDKFDRASFLRIPDEKVPPDSLKHFLVA